MKDWQAQWIRSTEKSTDCPVFEKKFKATKKASGKLYISSLGVYEAKLNGHKIGDWVLTPGWTVYRERVQFQEYDITDLLQEENVLEVTVSAGWYRGRLIAWSEAELASRQTKLYPQLFAEIQLLNSKGDLTIIPTDETWQVKEGKLRFSELYDGETYDSTFEGTDLGQAVVDNTSKATLIPQEGEPIQEQEVVYPQQIFTTPKGETVIDFGQNLAGYVSFSCSAHKGDMVEISHAEVLDKEGNFYTANYRAAKAKILYTCSEGEQSHQPELTFFGFRYIRLDQFPGTPKFEDFKAIAIHSNMKRTGYITTSDKSLNKLFENIIWGQRSNFIDVPTDCPQRDERMGWTGDAEVFIKTASYNYDVNKFFTKWLRDMVIDQGEDGSIPDVIPKYDAFGSNSSGWADALTICPWQLYLTYGNVDIIKELFPAIKKYVDSITNATKDQFLWTGGQHYGDWLGLDSKPGSSKGASRDDLVATAYYAYSTSLLVKIGKIIGENVEAYENLHAGIVKTFRKAYPVFKTQTECILALQFELVDNEQEIVEQLVELIHSVGDKIQTGFLGTPFILHVLSRYGYSELAYKLLLRKEYPSWLYPISKGATTIWEHWDGIMEDGSFWSDEMNSYNHYAYGAVADWIYEAAAGINTDEENPGFKKVIFKPLPTAQLEWVEAVIETREGRVSSKWTKQDDGTYRYEFETPVPAKIILGDQQHEVSPGRYTFIK